MSFLIFHFCSNKIINNLHMLKKCLCLFFICISLSQNFGNVIPENHVKTPYFECNSNNCERKEGAVTLDAAWRWLHYVENYDSCNSFNSWDPKYCPDPITCAKNCGYEGVNGPDNYKVPYGIVETSDGVRLNYVTKTETGQNVGQRAYLLESENKYKMFKLANRQFSFDMDSSTLQCGMNGSVYLAEMDEDGGSSKYPNNKAGAKYGTGYCDAQCSQTSFISGEANSKAWGNYAACCPQFDLWQANKQASVYTAHPCKTPGYYRCQGTDCGFDDKRYQGVCDKDGCGLNPYRNGNLKFYGPGSEYQVDTSKPFKVVTQFVTLDGTDSGDVSEIRRFYVQNGKKIDFPAANISGMSKFNSMSNQNCQSQISKFGDSNSFLTTGGMKVMGQALKRGMVLVFSLWDDYGSHMKWMDGTFPQNADPSIPGVVKGPCSKESGNPEDLRRDYPNAYMSVGNIKYGPFGSTYKAEEPKLQTQ